MKAFFRSMVVFICLVLFIGISSCQSGPKRFKDPEILAKMRPVELAFYNASDLVKELYEKYKAIQNQPTLPFGFERLDTQSFNADLKEIEYELQSLEYRNEEPYASAVGSMLEVTKLAVDARKKYWAVEETLASGRPPVAAVKMDAIASVGRCAKALKAAAEKIHIPQKEWPEWIKKQW